MTGKLIGCVAAAWVAAILAGPASGQPAVPEIDGDLWLESSQEVRKAFLIGAGSMIAVEAAYARRKGTPRPSAGALAAEALDGLTLDQISQRVTRWYEVNSDRRDMPVMGVIWIDMVDPTADPGSERTAAPKG